MKTKCLLTCMCVVSLLFVVACTDSEEQLGGGGTATGNYVLSATIENYEVVETRTVVQGNAVQWEKEDRVGVYGANTRNIPFACHTLQGSTAEFSGTLVSGDQEPLFAYYPYQEGVEYQDGALSIVLPSEYEYTGSSNAPMVGLKSEGQQYVFRHLCGLLHITVNDLPESAERFVVTAVGENAPGLAGHATVRNATVANATLTLDEESSRSVTYHLDALKSGSGFRGFFIPLPVGIYPELQVALYEEGQTEPNFTRTLSDVSVERGAMVKVAVMNAETGDDYVLNEKTHIMPEEVSARVTQSEADLSTLIYGAEVADGDVPKAGTIVLARASATLPYGFLGRVTEVKAGGDGSRTVLTEPVALSEAFDKLYIDETVELQPEGSEQPETKLLNPIFYDDELPYKFNVSVGAQHGGYAEGTISGAFRLTVNVNFDKENRINYAAFTTECDVKLSDVELGIKYSEDSQGNKKEKILKEKLFEWPFARIPLANGLIQVVATGSANFGVSASGAIDNKIDCEYEYRFVAGAEYKDGQWEKGRRGIPLGNHESPWSFEKLAFDGSLSSGLEFALNLKLYNSDKMKGSFSIEAGGEVSGSIPIGEIGKSSIGEVLNNVTLSSCVYVQGGFNADFVGLEGQIPIGRGEFLSKQIKVLPTIKQLIAKTQAASEELLSKFNADINTEASGELITKDAQISLALADGRENVLQYGESTAYNGGKTLDSDPDVVVPLTAQFNSLDEGEDYQVYPVVTSPLFEEVAEGGRVELKDLAVPLEYHTPERDILIAFYKATNGDNWTNNTNWCSDRPLDEWYGVRTDGEGYVMEMYLDDNNLTGTARLSGLSRLMTLYLSGNHFTGVDFGNLPELVDLRLERNEDIITMDFPRSIGKELSLYINSNPKLTQVKVDGLSEITQLYLFENASLSSVTGISNLASLELLYIQECPAFTSVQVRGLSKLRQISVLYNENLSSLQVKDLPELVWLFCEHNALTSLTVSDFPNLEDLKCQDNRLRTLEVSNLPNTTYIDCSFNQLGSLVVNGFPKLFQLNCNDNQLTSLSMIGMAEVSPWFSFDCENNNLSSLDLRGIDHLRAFGAYGNPIKVVYVREDMGSVVTNGYTYWGEQDKDEYEYPEHHDGWQYPRFVWN